MSYVYDAGVLIAADRNVRRVWADHKARIALGLLPLVPTTVIAQVSRSPTQAQLRRFLRGCKSIPLDEPTAHAAGLLLATTRTNDIVDATVVAIAAAHEAAVVTTDPDDIERLARASTRRPRVVAL